MQNISLCNDFKDFKLKDEITSLTLFDLNGVFDTNNLEANFNYNCTLFAKNLISINDLKNENKEADPYKTYIGDECSSYKLHGMRFCFLNFNLDSIYNLFFKSRLALAYLENSELYSEDKKEQYRAFIEKEKEIMTIVALKTSSDKALSYLKEHNLYNVDDAKCISKHIYTLYLESYIKADDKENVKALLTCAHDDFLFYRLIAISCLYASIEMTELLISFNFSFLSLGLLNKEYDNLIEFNQKSFAIFYKVSVDDSTYEVQNLFLALICDVDKVKHELRGLFIEHDKRALNSDETKLLHLKLLVSHNAISNNQIALIFLYSILLKKHDFRDYLKSLRSTFIKRDNIKKIKDILNNNLMYSYDKFIYDHLDSDNILYIVKFLRSANNRLQIKDNFIYFLNDLKKELSIEDLRNFTLELFKNVYFKFKDKANFMLQLHNILDLKEEMFLEFLSIFNFSHEECTSLLDSLVLQKELSLAALLLNYVKELGFNETYDLSL